jgi:hypothetical protein
MKIVAAAVAVFFACAFGGGAKAETFYWTYTGTFYKAAGAIDASLIPTGPHAGDYQVTFLDGSDNYGDTLSGPDNTFGSDNVLYLAASAPHQVDATGIGFILTGPQAAIAATYLSVTYNTDFFGACSYVSLTCDAYVDAGAFAARQTPLPAAVPMFAGGLGVIGTLLGWRRKRQRADA